VIVVGERLHVARGTVEGLELPAGEVAVRGLPLIGLAVAILGVALGVAVVRIAVVATEARPPPDWGGRIVRRLHAARGALGLGAVAAWGVWQVLGVLGADAWPLHLLAVGLAVLAVVGGALPGDVGEAWGRAAVVRLQLVFLLALFVIVFIAPITSDQLTDVLRAWGDGPAERALAGLGAALLLGAVGRSSAARLLLPPGRITVSGGGGPVRVGVAAGAGVAALVLWRAARLEAAATAALAVALLAAFTTPAPRTGAGEDADTLRRLAGTLGVVPVAILLAGLAAAATDSLLLPSPLSGADAALLGWTAVAAAAFGLLAVRAQAPRAGSRSARPTGTVPLTRGDFDLAGPAAGLAGLLAVLAVLVAPVPAALALLALGAVLAWRPVDERAAPELWGGAGAALGAGIAVFADPLGAAHALGAFGAALLGLTGILVLLHPVGLAGVHLRTSSLLGAPRRAPVVVALGAWLLVAFLTAPATVHQARTAEVQRDPASLRGAVRAWLGREQAALDRADPAPRMPMLLVAASGGGSKAAYWTDLVLDCLLGDARPAPGQDECGPSPRAGTRLRRLLAISSVSGGSVGVHHLVTHLGAAGRDRPWVRRTAGRELLSPLVAWGVFHDLPVLLLGLATDPSRCAARLGCPVHADRALVQEAAVARLGDARARDADGPVRTRRGPVTVMNATIGLGPGRLLLSRLALAPPRPGAGCRVDGREPVPEAVDGADVLIGRDTPLVTAAMLSARFPVLEPQARLGTRERLRAGGCRPPPARPAVRVRDGGLVENTGLLTLVDLLPAIRAAVGDWKRQDPRRARIEVPLIVVSVDDDVLGVDGDSEYRGGIAAGLVTGDPDERSRDARAWLRDCRRSGVVFRRISPAPHAGAQAATGWEISRTSREEDLVASIGADATTQALRDVQDWLDGAPPPGCPRSPG
jgi:hypothetical protein